MCTKNCALDIVHQALSTRHCSLEIIHWKLSTLSVKEETYLNCARWSSVNKALETLGSPGKSEETR